MTTRIDDLKMRHDALSLLVRLYRHRPQRHHTPRENYVTEAFAAVLATDPALLKAFYQHAAGESVPETVRIDTQVPTEGGVFDIVVRGDNFYYVIETKFTAPFARTANEGGHQFERYAMAIACRREARKGIISITLGNPPSIELPVSLSPHDGSTSCGFVRRFRRRRVIRSRSS